MSTLKLLSKDTAVYGIGTVLKKIIGLFLLPFYTRALSPSEFGILSTLSTIILLATALLSLGLSGATSRYYFIAESIKEKGKVLYTSLVIRLFSYLVPLSILVFFTENISQLLFNTKDYKYAVVFTLFTIFLTAMFNIQMQIFRFNRQPWKFSLVNIVRAVTTPASGILLVVILEYGVFGATLASMISSMFVLIFAFFYYTRKKYYTVFSFYWAKKMLKFGWPLIFSGILLWINNSSDRFFILHYADLEQLGFYSIGNTFSQPIFIINMALTMGAAVLVFSLFSEEKKDKNKPKTKEFLTKIWYSYLSIGVTVAIIISVFSYEIVKFVTTPEYIMGILAIPFLVFGHLFYQSSQITGNGMTLLEKSKPYFWIMLVSAGVNVILNFFFVPRFGFVGAAITTVFSNFIYFIIAYFWSQKVFYIKRSFVKPMMFLLIGLCISIFFPFAQLRFNMEISFLYKLIAVLFSFILPFLFGLVNVNILTNLKPIKKK